MPGIRDAVGTLVDRIKTGTAGTPVLPEDLVQGGLGHVPYLVCTHPRTEFCLINVIKNIAQKCTIFI